MVQLALTVLTFVSVLHNASVCVAQGQGQSVPTHAGNTVQLQGEQRSRQFSYRRPSFDAAPPRSERSPNVLQQQDRLHQTGLQQLSEREDAMESQASGAGRLAGGHRQAPNLQGQTVWREQSQQLGQGHSNPHDGHEISPLRIEVPQGGRRRWPCPTMAGVTAVCQSAWGRTRRRRCPTKQEVVAFCQRSSEICNNNAPLIQAMGSFGAFCLAAAALGLSRWQLQTEKYQSIASMMGARAATAQAIHGGSMERSGTYVVDEQNRINPYSLRSAAGTIELERRAFLRNCLSVGSTTGSGNPGKCGLFSFRGSDPIESQLSKNPPPAPPDPYLGPDTDYASLYNKLPPYPITPEMLKTEGKTKRKQSRKLMNLAHDQVGIPLPSTNR